MLFQLSKFSVEKALKLLHSCDIVGDVKPLTCFNFAIYHILTYSSQGNVLRTYECNQERLLSPLINRVRLSICFLSEDTRPGLCVVLLSFLSFPLPSLSVYVSTVPSTPTILHAWPATFFVPFMPIFRQAIRSTMWFSRTRHISLVGYNRRQYIDLLMYTNVSIDDEPSTYLNLTIYVENNTHEIKKSFGTNYGNVTIK